MLVPPYSEALWGGVQWIQCSHMIYMYNIVNIYWEGSFVPRYGQVCTYVQGGFKSTSITPLPAISLPPPLLATFIKDIIHHLSTKKGFYQKMLIQSYQRNH